MRILLATDAWEPQVNGVVRTLTRTVAEYRAMGHEVDVISPDQFKTLPMPTYPEIRLALNAYDPMQERFKAFEPEAIHIATEGPVGLAARRLCLEWKLPFTTSYHTRFPEYVSARFPVPSAAGYAYMRWFHSPSGRVMVATPTMRDELERRGFRNLSPWTRGVDTDLFPPGRPPARRARGRDAAVLPQRRPGGGGEEHRGLPGARPARDQGGGRRGPADGRAADQVPRDGVQGRPVRRGAGAALLRRRRVRVPLAHRHLRPGDPGGHGLRYAGGGLPGAGADRPDPGFGRGRPGQDLRQ